jgi:serine/threonine-protein kinase
MQRAASSERRRPASAGLGVRVGASIGEVEAPDDGDLYGRPVVEASRLCTAAHPGEVLVTDTLRTLCGGRAGVTFETVALMDLKGLPEPVAVSRVLWEPEHRRVLRCVLADDAVLVREGVARLLEEHGVEVVAQASDRDELRRFVTSLRPDIVITDVRMPPTHELEGLQVAEEIRREQPGVGVILLSQHLEARYALRLVQAGGEGIGYLLKERVTDLDEFVAAVHRVAAGGAAIDPEVIQGLLARRRSVQQPIELDATDAGQLAAVAEGRAADEGAEELLGRLGVGDEERGDPVRAALTLLAGGEATS